MPVTSGRLRGAARGPGPRPRWGRRGPCRPPRPGGAGAGDDAAALALAVGGVRVAAAVVGRPRRPRRRIVVALGVAARRRRRPRHRRADGGGPRVAGAAAGRRPRRRGLVGRRASSSGSACVGSAFSARARRSVSARSGRARPPRPRSPAAPAPRPAARRPTPRAHGRSWRAARLVCAGARVRAATGWAASGGQPALADSRRRLLGWPPSCARSAVRRAPGLGRLRVCLAGWRLGRGAASWVASSSIAGASGAARRTGGPAGRSAPARRGWRRRVGAVGLFWWWAGLCRARCRASDSSMARTRTSRSRSGAAGLRKLAVTDGLDRLSRGQAARRHTRGPARRGEEDPSRTGHRGWAHVAPAPHPLSHTSQVVPGRLARRHGSGDAPVSPSSGPAEPGQHRRLGRDKGGPDPGQRGQHVVRTDQRDGVGQHHDQLRRRGSQRHHRGAGVEVAQPVLGHPLHRHLGLGQEACTAASRRRPQRRPGRSASASRSAGRPARPAAARPPRRRRARAAARRPARGGPRPVPGLGQPDLQVLGLAGRAGREPRSRRRSAGAARTRRSTPSARRPGAAPARRPARSRGGW